MRITTSAVLAVVVSLSLCGHAVAENPVFANRQYVNILNTLNPDMKITNAAGTLLGAVFADSSGTVMGRSLRMFHESFSYCVKLNDYLEVDFGEVQNVLTIRARFYQNDSEKRTLWPTEFDVYYWCETAGAYQPIGSTATSFEKNNGVITLDRAVDTQKLKIVPATLDSETNKEGAYIFDLRMYGAPGEWSPVNNNIDLISSRGLYGATATSPVVTISAGGGANVSNGSGMSGLPAALRFVDDDPATMIRDLIYPISTVGAWVEVRFTNGEVYDFDTLGISGLNASKDALFTLEVLSGVDAFGQDIWKLVKINGQNTFAPFGNGSLSGGYFDLPFNAIGSGIRLTLVDSGGGGNWINDIQLFGRPIPEPVTLTLLALGGVVLLRRRGR